MRLTDAEISEIKTVFLKWRVSPQCRLFLFGSRLDPLKNGGDIDLLVEVPTPAIKTRFKRLDFLVDLKKAIGERKIDITVASSDEMCTDDFLSSVMAQAALLVDSE